MVSFRAKRLKAKGEGYGHIVAEQKKKKLPLPDWRLSLLPLIMVIVINVLLSNPFDWSWAYHWDENMLETFIPLKLSLIAAKVIKVQAI